MEHSETQSTYRWVIVIASAFILAISMGSIVNGLSAFVIPLEQAYGWQRGDISLINFSGLIGLAFGGLVMGPLADKKGTRPVVLFGVTILGLSYFTASFVNALWHYYLIFFLAGFFGAGAIFPPVMAAVGNWFLVGAGTAIGIASAGQALGQGGIPFVSSYMIAAFGVDWAFRATGIVMLVILIPLALLLRQPPESDSKSSDVSADEAKVPIKVVIVGMSTAIILCCTCMSVPLMHLVPLIQDRGFALEEASGVIFSMLLIAILGRVAFGRLADIVGALPAYMTATAWMTLLVFGFVYIHNLTSFYAYALVYGFGYAGVMTGVLVSIRSLSPVSHRASVLGIVIMFGWFGHAIGGYLGGLLYDLSGNYTASYALAATAGILNLMVVSSLYRKTRGPGSLSPLPV